MKEYKELYNQFIKLLKFIICLNELYTFVKKKNNRVYVWTAVGITKTKRKFYFYYLSKNKNANALFNFNLDLPKVGRILFRRTFCL